MAQERTFTLIGNFTDNITPKINQINKSLESMRRTMQSFSNRNTGFNSITNSIGKVVSAYKRLAAEQKNIRGEINLTNNALRQQSTLLNHTSKEVGRTASAYRHLTGQQRLLRTGINEANSAMRRHFIALDGLNSKIGRSVGAHQRLSSEQRNLKTRIDQSNSSARQHSVLLNRVTRSMNSHVDAIGRMSAKGGGAQMWENANRQAQNYHNTLRSLRGAMPPVPPGGRRGGAGRVGVPGVGAATREGGGGVLGDIIKGGLITQGIVMGFQQGVAIFQQGIAKVMGAFAERAKDQLEDIASAGGIFSAAKFGGAKGLPATFQGALEMQDDINKSMAQIASALPGTTQDYVMNARRMTDTLAQVMSKDTKNFEALAKKLSGDISIQGSAAFEVINVEVAKATTLLEKLNPTRTVVPMTQIVEDMMKSEKVTIAGLRRYVSFRRATTFEAALNRNLEELNKAGAGTSARLSAIIKTLKEAVPPELITAMTTSVSGVIEGFKSAVMDPDVGIFGMSRTLSMTVLKFNRETGKPILDKLGRQVSETTNFFKMFSETFGNLGNLINSALLPGIMSIYNPFERMAEGLVKIREYSYEIFERQQAYTTYFSGLAEKYGMSTGAFKSGEKGAVSTVLDVLKGFNMITMEESDRIVAIMKKQAPAKQIEADMKNIYQMIIPKIFDSPFFTQIGMVVGDVLARVLTVIADTVGALLNRTAPSGNAFVESFIKGGGMDALNRLFIYLAEIIGKLIIAMIKMYATALGSALASGNLIAAGVMAAPLAMIPGIGNIGGFIGGKLKGRVTKGKGGGGGKVTGYVPESVPRRVERFEGIRSPAFRAMTRTRMVNPAFPQVALGTYPAVGGVTAPGRAPSIPRRIPGAASVGALGRAGMIMRGVQSKALGSLAAFAMNPRVGPAISKLGTALAGPGLGALKSPMQLMKASGNLGPLAIVTSIISAVAALLRGESLANALGKGAGPLIGSAIGFALLGPLGGFIGAWIGSMESVTEPLGATFQAVFGTLKTTFDIVTQVGGDILGLLNGLVKSIPGVGKGFDILRFAIFALLSPFKLLEIGINGIYDLYLTIKKNTLGLSKEEEARLNERRTQRAADEFTIQGREAAGYSLAQQKAAEMAKFREAKRKGDEAAMNRIAEYVKSLDRMIKDRGGIPQAVATPATPRTPAPVSIQTPTVTTPVGLPVAMDMEKLRATVKMLGYESNTQVTEYVNSAQRLRDITRLLDHTKTKLDAKAKELASQGVRPEEMKKYKQFRELSERYGVLKDKASQASSSLDKAFRNMPQDMAKAINTNMAKMPLSDIERAIADRIRMASVQAQINVPVTMPGPGGGTFTLPRYPTIDTKVNPQTGLPGWLQEGLNQGGLSLPSRNGGPNRFMGGLGDAISSEMRNKPSGSSLVIANSSESVIPAAAGAAGFGMENFVSYMSAMATNTASGNSILNTIKYTMVQVLTSISKNSPILDAILSKTDESIRVMTSGAMRVKFMIGGVGGKGGPGAVDAFNPIASSYGLQITSGYRPGDPGYHGVDRARDYSNSTGPTPQMHAFATFMAATFGGDLSELIYTPLGFSIKNGMVTPPYAQAGHYNHVHVAYAMGRGAPRVFSSKEDARRWEEKMAPKYASIATVTANSSEGFGGGNTINAPITIYQQPGQDPEELASLVAMRLSMAVDQLRNH